MSVDPDDLLIGFEVPCRSCHGSGDISQEDLREWRRDAGLYDPTPHDCPRCRGVGAELTDKGVDLYNFMVRHIFSKNDALPDIEEEYKD